MSGSTTVGYQYDHTGKRVKTQSPSGNVITPSDYETLDGGAKTLRHILFGDLGSIATSTYDSSTSTSSIVYHHKDHLGGTHVESDSSGTAIEYILYKPFGDTLVDNKTGSYENKFKYTGKQKDVDTGYYYYGSRYYNAVGGRFQSEDLVFLNLGIGGQDALKMLSDPQVLNSYSYATNNPIGFIDKAGDSPSIDASSAAPSYWQCLQMANYNPILAAAYYMTAQGVAHDIETLSDPEASASSRVLAAVSLGANFIGGEGEAVKIVSGADDAFRSFKGAIAGFRSFDIFKSVFGSARSGFQWHHIVEQRNAGVFGKELINSTENLIEISKEVHQEISSYYSSIDPSIDSSQTVRQWLNGQSFDKQLDFGKQTLEKFGVNLE